jgi:hypothetical protein
MSHVITNILSKLWDAQVVPKEDCKTFEAHIARLEERRSGRTIRAVAAGVLAVPLIVIPIVTTLTSAFNVTGASSSDNPLNQGMTTVPQVFQVKEAGYNGIDILKGWAEGAGLLLGIGLAGFAGKRARDADMDSKKIASVRITAESHYHLRKRAEPDVTVAP